MVVNTEHRKCNRIPTGTQAEKEIGDGDTIVESNLSEEELIEMMHFAQVSDKSKQVNFDYYPTQLSLAADGLCFEIPFQVSQVKYYDNCRVQVVAIEILLIRQLLVK